MSNIHNNTADTNETAADEAAVEQQPKRAASEISANLRGSPTNTLRRELQAMMRKVEELSGQLAEERSQRELLTHQLAAKTTDVSAQVEAALSAGEKAKETEPITPGQALNAAEDKSAHVEQTELPPAHASESEPAAEEVKQVAETVAVAAVKPLTFDALQESMDEDQRDIIEKHIVGLRTALETVRAQLGLVLAQAAIARRQIGVTPRQLLTELGYSDEEITRMMGDAALEDSCCTLTLPSLGFPLRFRS